MRKESNEPVEAVVVCGRDELVRHKKDWDDLACHAAEPNVFFESWMFLPALEFLVGARRKVRVVLIWSTGAGAAANQRLLIGFFPLELCFGYRGLPVPYATVCQHIHCFLCTPLMRSGFERECLAGFFSWLEKTSTAGLFLELKHFSADGPFFEQLKGYLVQEDFHWEIVSSYRRGLLRSDLSSEAYIERYGAKQKKEIRRKLKRLSEMGKVSFERLENRDEVERWIADFLALEERGWKGEQSTAMAKVRPEKLFFESVCRAASERGRLEMLRLTLNGRLLALQCNFLSGSGAFAFKIAYDEEFSNWSPGALLFLENVRNVLEYKSVSWMDSCADPASSLVNPIFLERRHMCSIHVARRRRGVSAWLIKLLAGLRLVVRKLRRNRG